MYLTCAVRHKLSRLFFKEIRVKVGHWLVFQLMEKYLFGSGTNLRETERFQPFL